VARFPDEFPFSCSLSSASVRLSVCLFAQDLWHDLCRCSSRQCQVQDVISSAATDDCKLLLYNTTQNPRHTADLLRVISYAREIYDTARRTKQQQQQQQQSRVHNYFTCTQRRNTTKKAEVATMRDNRHKQQNAMGGRTVIRAKLLTFS